MTDPPSVAMPIAAVIAVVVRQDRVLLVRRANPPDAGLWGFPGGKIELGETVAAAALRELAEETAVEARTEAVMTTLDVFEKDGSGRIARHFILVAVLCRWLSGEAIAGDDALEAAWFTLDALDPSTLPMSADVDVIARRALGAPDHTT
ncbi:NUDIX hydrolase [Microvirga pudoricolor]|uniref:NUDIX hydrolase n=1 Tax=Microvirga pudoricolor TaxID=2778729 RepID=UPI001951904D|nr:NUDIX hydrolase [Microvirga pudoricolor]MBM6596560.1 NUDIX hydrolase [Microvirga pudoricolor]